jgi:hypothetical protein
MQGIYLLAQYTKMVLTIILLNIIFSLNLKEILKTIQLLYGQMVDQELPHILGYLLSLAHIFSMKEVLRPILIKIQVFLLYSEILIPGH